MIGILVDTVVLTSAATTTSLSAACSSRGPTTSIGDAARRMLRDHLHAVPVVDHAGALLGMLSASDIVAWVAGIRPSPA
jgi:CBS-domain-containing membrane protein